MRPLSLAALLLVAAAPARGQAVDEAELKKRRLEVFAKDGDAYKYPHLVEFVFTGTRYADSERDRFLGRASASSMREVQWRDIDTLLGGLPIDGTHALDKDAGGADLRGYIEATKLPLEELYFLGELDRHRRGIVRRWGEGTGGRNMRANCMRRIGAPAERTRCDDRRDDLNEEVAPILSAQKPRRWVYQNITANDDPSAWTDFGVHNVACYIYEKDGVLFQVVPDSWENTFLSARSFFHHWDKSKSRRVFRLLDAAGEKSFCDIDKIAKAVEAQRDAEKAEKFLTEQKVAPDKLKGTLLRIGLDPKD